MTNDDGSPIKAILNFGFSTIFSRFWLATLHKMAGNELNKVYKKNGPASAFYVEEHPYEQVIQMENQHRTQKIQWSPYSGIIRPEIT